MDFMNLNQAAHGDREFGYIQTRLGVPRRPGGRARRPIRPSQSRIAAWQRAARGVAAIRRLKLARFGDNMRDVAVTEGDKVEAAAAVRRVGQHLRRQRPGRPWSTRSPTPRSTSCSRQYADVYDIVPELAVGGDRHESLRYGARIEAGLRSFLTDGGFGAFTTNFEDLGGLRQLPGLAVQRLMADGYGFGGEGDWKTSVMLHTIKAIGAGVRRHLVHGGLHLPPGPGTPKILGAHMLEVCPASPPAGRGSRSIRSGIGDREDPVRLVFDAAPGPAIVVGICDLGDRFRLVLNEVDVVPPDEPLPKLPVARACGNRSRTWPPRPSPGSPPAARTTRCCRPRSTPTSCADFANLLGVELLIIDGSTNRRDFADRIRWNQAYYRLAQGF